MDAFLAIASKREVRSYDERPISPDAERRILEAGRVAGSSRNRQARRFVVVRDPGLVQQVADAVYAPDNVRGAALVVAIVVGAKGPTSFDAGRAAQNMMLAAWNDGVTSSPNGVRDADAATALLGLAGEERPATVLTFGHPATGRDPGSRPAAEWSAGARRRSLEEVVRRL